MRINTDFKLREIAGESVIVQQGKAGVDLTRIISLNVSARLLYEQLTGRDFTTEDAAGILAATYHLEAEQASLDAVRWVKALKDCHLIED